MDEVLTGNIWRQIKSIAEKCAQRVAALAYVSRSDLLAFGKGDILVCDASNAAIKSGETSAKALLELYERGVHIYSSQNLHAKVVVMGRYALIGSANLSAQSTLPFREASLLTSQTSAVSQARAFIHKAKRNADAVDRAFISRIQRIKVKRFRGSHQIHRGEKRLLGSRFWITRIDECERNVYWREASTVKQAERNIRMKLNDPERELEWFRCSPSDNTALRKEAREGDTVVQLVSPAGSDRVTVFAPTAILRRQDKDGWTRFYLDESDSLRSMSWTEFHRRLRKAGVKHIKKTSCREISRNDIHVVESAFEE